MRAFRQREDDNETEEFDWLGFSQNGLGRLLGWFGCWNLKLSIINEGFLYSPTHLNLTSHFFVYVIKVN